MSEQFRWWQRGVVYQVYPRSFLDSDGDGIGDLPGITRKLGYLQWLGVDAVWISPIFPSPMADFGYDVSDYTGIEPVFGTLDDFDRLLAEAHRRGLKVLLDYVPNHSSDQHPWFVESRSSRDNPKRDWYLWRDPAPGGGPPNNWFSNFGIPGWTLDEATGQFYYHAYLREQPDLNWRNPEVRRAMLDVLRRAAEAFAVGRYRAVEAEGDILAYLREGEGRRFLVVLNLGHDEQRFAPAAFGVAGKIVLTTVVDGELALRGAEGVIVELG